MRSSLMLSEIENKFIEDEKEQQKPKSAKVAKRSNQLDIKPADASIESKLLELSKGKILVAENAPINMQVIKNQLAELKEADRCVFTFDGEEAVKEASKIIKNAIE